jgi:uncharacterized protein YprB with RNaseH-like and TPR domain
MIFSLLFNKKPNYIRHLEDTMKTLSIDIESYAFKNSNSIYMIGYTLFNGMNYTHYVLYGEQLRQGDLNHLVEKIMESDIVIGWNITNFDIRNIEETFNVNLTNVLRGKLIDVSTMFHTTLGISHHVSLKDAEPYMGLKRNTMDVVKNTMKYWIKWTTENDRKALDRLIAYNKEDCINPYIIYQMLTK